MKQRCPPGAAAGKRRREQTDGDEALFTRLEGSAIHLPRTAIAPTDEPFDEQEFLQLFEMQQRHFWYQGRHRFLLRAVRDELRVPSGAGEPSRAIDLGGGCGGWLRYLHRRSPALFSELALGDSSKRALELAEPIVGGYADLYQVDLAAIGWARRWDVVFLLDVLEHIRDDLAVLEQIREALSPGGRLFLTTPALKRFWSYNDELGRHHRRYSRADLQRLAGASGLELCRSRYFHFFLSPLLLASRMRRVDLERMSTAEIRTLTARTHRVPSAPLNQLLRAVFALETPLGWWLPFPWGTSVLGVFRRVD